MLDALFLHRSLSHWVSCCLCREEAGGYACDGSFEIYFFSFFVVLFVTHNLIFVMMQVLGQSETTQGCKRNPIKVHWILASQVVSFFGSCANMIGNNFVRAGMGEEVIGTVQSSTFLWDLEKRKGGGVPLCTFLTANPCSWVCAIWMFQPGSYNFPHASWVPH
jgi:hypothetical protein